MLSSDLKDGVLRIRFHAPEVGNSFSVEDAEQLQKILKASSEIQILIWEHDSKMPFCSGGNLKFYSGLTKRLEGLRANRQISASLQRLKALRVLKIAVARGDCFGGGMELLGCFDCVLAAPHTQFGLWQRKIGLAFGWGGGARLEEKVGRDRLLCWATSATVFTSYQALRWGLVNEVVAERHMDTRLKQIIENEISLPKEAGLRLRDWTVAKEKGIFEKLWWGVEHRKALARFSKRRS